MQLRERNKNNSSNQFNQSNKRTFTPFKLSDECLKGIKRVKVQLEGIFCARLASLSENKPDINLPANLPNLSSIQTDLSIKSSIEELKGANTQNDENNNMVDITY